MNEQNNLIENTEVTEAETAVIETAPALTAKEVFDQIVALQNLITNENTNPLYSLSDAIGFICRDTMWTSDELRCGAVNAASTPYRMREETYQKMLAVYQQMYNDLKPQNEAKYAERREFMNWVRDCIDATQCGQDLPDFERLWNIFN